MRCAWEALVNLLPFWLRNAVDKQGSTTLLELRLRLNAPAELITTKGKLTLQQCICEDDLQFCVNIASRYSPWTAATISHGYLTAPGGHRIGVCGNAIMDNGKMTGVNRVTSLCVRVARDFPGIAGKVQNLDNSTLIIGRPGSGKTTFLRDLIRQYGKHYDGSIAVVDEREEIFPMANGTFCFTLGNNVDVLTGCSKSHGMNAVLRSMGPQIIATDEITSQEDCESLIQAGWCGVKLLATAHAGSKRDLLQRPIYRPIIESKLFDTLIVLHPDKSWHEERL